MRILFIAGLMLALCAAGSAHAACTPGSLDLRWPGGQAHFTVEVAADQAAREKGLMFRDHMASSAGMIFVYQAPNHARFWMKNTLLPLTAAFIADDGTIVNLADMKPQSTDSHCSAQPVRYVLGMNQGWFAKKGIKAGARLSGPPFEAKR